jgi:hypothetical protein
MMIGIGRPISHKSTPRMVLVSVYGGVVPLKTSETAWSSSNCLSGDGAAARGLELERGCQQRLGVVRLGFGEHRLRRTLLHHLAVPEHDDRVGERAHDLQIVANEQISELVATL